MHLFRILQSQFIAPRSSRNSLWTMLKIQLQSSPLQELKLHGVRIELGLSRQCFLPTLFFSAFVRGRSSPTEMLWGKGVGLSSWESAIIQTGLILLAHTLLLGKYTLCGLLGCLWTPLKLAFLHIQHSSLFPFNMQNNRPHSVTSTCCAFLHLPHVEELCDGALRALMYVKHAGRGGVLSAGTISLLP